MLGTILIVIGFLLWMANRFIPMAGRIKFILNAVVVIAGVFGLLNILGIFSQFPHHQPGGMNVIKLYVPRR